MRPEQLKRMIDAFECDCKDEFGHVDHEVFERARQSKSLSTVLQIFEAAGYDGFMD